MNLSVFYRYPVARRLGRRGTVLILVGLAWIGIGIGIWNNPVERFSRPGVDGNGYLEFMDKPWTAVVWASCGLVATLVGIFRGSKIMNEREVFGFNAALTPPLLWTLTYAWSIIAYLLSDGLMGRASSFVAVIIYTIVTLFILVIAGWPDPPEPAVFEIPKFSPEDGKG